MATEADNIPAAPPVGSCATGVALELLRARYLRWSALDRQQVLQDREEAAADVRALQLVIRLERTSAPSWHRALSMAATLCAAMCVDSRAEPGGEWFQSVSAYCAGPIRKVTRRARGAQWDAITRLPGLSRFDGDTRIRAMVPGRTTDLDRRISRLQVAGTELPIDPAGPTPEPPVLTLFVPTEPAMTVGKLMAQTGHAAMIAAAMLAGDDIEGLQRWATAGCQAAVQRCDAATYHKLLSDMSDPEKAWQQRGLAAVRDAGFTEIAPGTVTVIARAPRSSAH